MPLQTHCPRTSDHPAAFLEFPGLWLRRRSPSGKMCLGLRVCINRWKFSLKDFDLFLHSFSYVSLSTLDPHNFSVNFVYAVRVVSICLKTVLSVAVIHKSMVFGLLSSR